MLNIQNNIQKVTKQSIMRIQYMNEQERAEPGNTGGGSASLPTC